MIDSTHITNPKNLLKEFIEKNINKYSQINTDKYREDLEDLDEIGSDDEIWLVNAPNNMTIVNQLIDQKIKLPGRSCHNSVETIAEEYNNEKLVTLGYRSKKRYTLKQLKVRGSISIRQKIPTRNTLSDVETNNNDSKSDSKGIVPFPTNLRLRHPLLGVDFEKELSLRDDILKKLESQKIKHDPDDSMQNNETYSNKSHKKSKKIKKEIVSDEPEEDLAWVNGVF